MRKYVVIVVMAIAATSVGRVQAQYSDHYYHRVGDTIEWKANNGYYSWWEFETFFENQLMITPTDWPFNLTATDANNQLRMFSGGLADSTTALQRFYTPTPLKIIGIAGCPLRGTVPFRDDHHPPIYIPDTNWKQEYFYIYEADSSGLTMKVEVPWSPFDPSRTLHIRYNGQGGAFEPSPDSCCNDDPHDVYIPLQEHYFDTPIWVTDSFYVGQSYFGTCDWLYHPDSLPIIYTAYYNASMNLGFPICNPEYQENYYSLCRPKGIAMVFKHEVAYNPAVGQTEYYADKEWYYTTHSPGTFLTYPIIEVDTTVPPTTACDPVANVQAAVSGTSATVTWDGFPFYSQLSIRYGLGNTPPAQWTTLDATGSTMYHLTDLQPQSRYGVSIQATCDTNKITTPWSAPVYFFTGTDTTGSGSDTTGHGSEGIGDTPTALASLTYLMPNPASDEVSVASSFNLLGIDIWTLDGVMVYHGDASGHDVRLDVSWLRPGSYIMAIHTHNGTTHKRLLIAR